MKLATHNSGTGESPKNLWAKCFGIFSRCQKLGLCDQYRFGVRLFDIRVRRNSKGEYYVYHGLSSYNITLEEAIACLSGIHLSRCSIWNEDIDENPPIVMVTYEGTLSKKQQSEFVGCVKCAFSNMSVKLGNIAVKLPKWKVLYYSIYHPYYISNYPKLSGWRAILPIPIFWNLFKKHIDSEEFVMEDFV